MMLLNQLQAVSVRIHTPKTGAWSADVDVDLDASLVVPSGRAILTINTTVLQGTIDARASGRFGAKAKIRLVAGGGGWDTPIPGLHHHNDAAVLTTEVYATAAASVGETVVELGPPKRLGVDFARMKGSASQVFSGVDWYVDLIGVTRVGPRLPLPPPLTLDILTWDATTMAAELACDDVLVPGMVLVDPLRFGTATIDEVEQTFSENGARAIAWCSTPDVAAKSTLFETLKHPPETAGSKLVRALGELARRSTGVDTLRKYAYRVVTQGPDGRINLQAVDLLGDAPPFLRLIDVWAGLPGLKVKLAPASVVLVSFIAGDKSKPIVTGFDPKAPPALEIKVDGLRIVAGTVGARPVACADTLTTVLTNILTGVGSALGANPAALAAAAAALPGIGSTKLFTD